MPGVAESAFWDPPTATSTPHASHSKGTEPTLDTQSTTSRTVAVVRVTRSTRPTSPSSFSTVWSGLTPASEPASMVTVLENDWAGP